MKTAGSFHFILLQIKGSNTYSTQENIHNTYNFLQLRRKCLVIAYFSCAQITTTQSQKGKHLLVERNYFYRREQYVTKRESFYSIHAYTFFFSLRIPSRTPLTFLRHVIILLTHRNVKVINYTLLHSRSPTSFLCNRH